MTSKKKKKKRIIASAGPVFPLEKEHASQQRCSLEFICITSIYFYFLPLTLKSNECRQSKHQQESEQALVSKSCWDSSREGLVAQETVNGVFKWILLPSSSYREIHHINSLILLHICFIIKKKTQTRRPDIISSHTLFYRSKLTGNVAYETSLVT